MSELQDRLDALPLRGGTVALDAKTYTYEAPLHVRGFTRLIGAGIGATTLRPRPGPAATAETPAVSLVGAGDCEVAGLRIDGGAEVTWGAGLMLGRWEPDREAARNLIRGVEVLGLYRAAAVYNMGAELCHFDTCRLHNALGAYAYATESAGSLGLNLPGGGLAGAAGERISNTCHRLTNCVFIVDGVGAEACILIGWGTAACVLDSPCLSSKRSSAAAIRIGSPNYRDAVHQLTISGAQSETPAAGVALEILTPVKSLTIRDSRWFARQFMRGGPVEGLNVSANHFYPTA